MGEIQIWDNITLIIQLIHLKSVAVYTGYVVREHGGNMNLGQYYISNTFNTFQSL